MGIRLCYCSATTGEGIERLAAATAGKVGLLIGGVAAGKTSLLAALAPDIKDQLLTARAGRVGRRPTTTATRMYRTAGGAFLVDMPGLSEAPFLSPSSEELEWCYYPDMTVLAGSCWFTDCTHSHEPGCEVKKALATGQLTRKRYKSYLALLSECQPENSSVLPRTKQTRPGKQQALEESGFRCAKCGNQFSAAVGGTRHRNHCPYCLWSRHLDETPGDRAAGCGGTMEPIAVWVRTGGEWAVIHHCQQCGHLSSNRIAADDNELLLLSLAAKPLAAPPFPLTCTVAAESVSPVAGSAASRR